MKIIINYVMNLIAEMFVLYKLGTASVPNDPPAIKYLI